MQAPASHPEEPKRLKALHALELLDTPIEERFERLTRTARQLLKMPIAAVTLVDAERQWFKSIQGLEATETPRDVSFCAHALLGPDTFVVPDARRDDRFADNPLVAADPWLRFYAGHPVCSADGAPLGTLCVADRKPRRFGPRERAMLKSLASAAAAELNQRIPGEAQRKLAADLKQQRRSAVDSLTRVWGREAILELLEREFRVARRKGTGIGTLIVDVDSRESLDQAMGFDGSDALIRKTARRLVRTLRPQDSVGRFGRGEFLSVLTTSDRAELAAIAQRIRARIARTPMASTRGRFPVTVSLGAAWAPAAGLRAPGALLDAASHALCSAQKRGGNRVEVRAA